MAGTSPAMTAVELFGAHMRTSAAKGTARAKDIYKAPADGFRLPPVHPGAALGSELSARSLSAHVPALKLAYRRTGFLKSSRASAGFPRRRALRLGRYFGNGAAFWINLQSHYDLALAEKELGARIAGEVEQAA